MNNEEQDDECGIGFGFLRTLLFDRRKSIYLDLVMHGKASRTVDRLQAKGSWPDGCSPNVGAPITAKIALEWTP